MAAFTDGLGCLGQRAQARWVRIAMAGVVVEEDAEATARRRRRTVAARGNCEAAARLPG